MKDIDYIVIFMLSFLYIVICIQALMDIFRCQMKNYAVYLSTPFQST